MFHLQFLKFIYKMRDGGFNVSQGHGRDDSVPVFSKVCR